MPMKTMLRHPLGAVVVALLAAQPAVGDQGVGADDLLDDLGGRHVARETRLAGRAERAVHAASRLRRDAQRDPPGVAHQHGLDEGAVVQLPQELDRVAAVGLEPSHLGQERGQHPVDELLATLGRQVGHRGRVVRPVREVVLLELLGAEAGRPSSFTFATRSSGVRSARCTGGLPRFGVANCSRGRPRHPSSAAIPRSSGAPGARAFPRAESSCSQGRGRTCVDPAGARRSPPSPARAGSTREARGR